MGAFLDAEESESGGELLVVVVVGQGVDDEEFGVGVGDVWTAGGFSDSACFVLQAAFFRSRKSLSTSFGVRYPRAE